MIANSLSRRRRRHAVISTAVAALALASLGATNAFAAEDPEWTVTETPKLESNYALNDVEVAASDDAWAVGYTVDQTWNGTVALHWDGEQWKATETPEGLTFQDAALDSEGAWAVGTAADAALTARWDGSAWQQVDSPAPELPSGQQPILHGITTDGDQPWAVGCGSDADEAAQTAYAQYYDGEKWQLTDVPAPEGSQSSCLRDVAVAGDDVWAVGRTDDGKKAEPFAVRWDGKEWSVVEMPALDEPDADLAAVAVNESADGPRLFAVGVVKDEYGSPVDGRPVMLTSDGESWDRVEIPDMKGWLTGLSVDAEGTAWVVGYTPTGSAILLRSSGDEVTELAAPSEASALDGVAATGGADDPIWVAGSEGESDGEMGGLSAHT